MLSEGLMDDLGDGQVIEVCLAPDGFDPALFDMEGSSLNAFQVQNNARILLVILFPRDTAAVTAWDSSDFWAFNEGMSEA